MVDHLLDKSPSGQSSKPYINYWDHYVNITATNHFLLIRLPWARPCHELSTLQPALPWFLRYMVEIHHRDILYTMAYTPTLVIHLSHLSVNVCIRPDFDPPALAGFIKTMIGSAVIQNHRVYLYMEITQLTRRELTLSPTKHYLVIISLPLNLHHMDIKLVTMTLLSWDIMLYYYIVMCIQCFYHKKVYWNIACINKQLSWF